VLGTPAESLVAWASNGYINRSTQQHGVRRPPEKQVQRKIALERIHTLFEQASKTKDQKLADRYVQLARKIQTRLKVRMPAELRYKYCKKCGSYWHQGTVRIRTREGKVVFTCLVCKTIRRKPYSKRI